MKRIVLSLALIASTALFGSESGKKVSVFGCQTFMSKCKNQAIAGISSRFAPIKQKMAEAQHHEEALFKFKANALRSMFANNNVAQKVAQAQHHEDLLMKHQATAVRSFAVTFVDRYKGITQVH